MTTPIVSLPRVPIGFIGLGVMGRHMAAHLSQASAEHVLGYDVSHAVWEQVDPGIGRADSLEALARQCSIVFLSLPGPKQVVPVVETLAQRLPLDAILVDMSTIDPHTAAAVSEQARSSHVAYVHSPVIGGQKGAQDATLTIIAGGDPTTLDIVHPYLQLLGTEVHLVDAPAEAAVLKLLNNLMSLGNTVVLAEALTLGTKAGVRPETVYRVLRTGSGFSAAFERRWHANIKTGNYAPGFAIDLAVKDLTLATAYGAELGMPLFAGTLTTQMYRMLQTLGWGERDVAALAAWWAEAAHVSLSEEERSEP